MIQPNTKVVSGSGKPRLVLAKASNVYASGTGTTYDATSVTEVDGATVNISSSSAANPTLITTATNHGRAIGDWIKIAGHAVSALNGKWQVLDTPAVNTLKVGYDNTGTGPGGASGTLGKTPAFSARGFAVNMRIVVDPNSSTANPLRWGKIVSVDDANNKIAVDQWIGGTPSNADPFRVNGWIADLPYCYSLVETFDPDLVTHALWRSRLSSKHYGWKYSASLDYSAFIVGDTLLALRPHLAMDQSDSLVLIPRIDQPAFAYNVFFSNAVDISMFGKGLGHKGVVLVFTATETVPSFPMLLGFGVGYANNYGNQL